MCCPGAPEPDQELSQDMNNRLRFLKEREELAKETAARWRRENDYLIRKQNEEDN